MVLPPACQSPGTVYYKTNHQNVVISSSSSPTIRRLAKQNPLDYLTLSDLSQASRSDFVHNHVNEILHNITAKVQNLECYTNIQELTANSFKDKDKDTRIRYMPSGELVFKLECPKVIYDHDQYVTRRLSADRDHADEQLHGDRCHLREHHLRPDRRHRRDRQTLQGAFCIHFLILRIRP